MNCHRISNLLSAYIDGELTGVEMIEIRRHLEDCPSCETELDCLRSTKRLLGRLSTAQPASDLADRICVSLNDVQPYSWLAAWTRFWHAPLEKLSPAVACVGVMALGLLTFAATNISQSPQAAQVAAASDRVMVATSPVSLMHESYPAAVPSRVILSTDLQNDVRHAAAEISFAGYSGSSR